MGIGVRLARGLLARADALMNRVYGWRYNPLYQSGTIVVALMIVLLVTGIYLTIFYRVAAPYESIVRLQGQVWVGRWVRAAHRYAADAAVFFAGVHALRLLLQGRSWGPRALAWVSGVALLGLILICGWTGYVMVWDVQAQDLAVLGARLLDVLPLFSEPILRTFAGERPVASAFFFLNLFAHIALPVGLLLVLWLHVSRVARPVLLPPRPVLWVGGGLLVLLSLVWPAALGREADLLLLAGRAPFDLWYTWWVPLATHLPVGLVWSLAAAAVVAVLMVPVIARPRADSRPLPSLVDERLCTGCEQCYLDCPYEAITMVARTDDRPTPVARVNSDLCTSCGICAGSCAPMGVGPPQRTGRDQLRGVKTFVAARRPGARDVVLAVCERGAGLYATDLGSSDGLILKTLCAGNLHTSVIEYLIRAGAGGVLVAACPPRDCWNREGAIWLQQRMYHDREAELQPRVDRARVRLVHASAAEAAIVRSALQEFRAQIQNMASLHGEESIDLMSLCKTADEETLTA
jgi:coenzyme F420-reducing hydrogenase delta subunit/Pyruvate/2-oxoacid:ferredoxin oxidoreductase delta subunit